MQSDFIRNFDFLGVFLSVKFVKFFFFEIHSLYHYTKNIDQEKRSNRSSDFFQNLNFKVFLFFFFSFLAILFIQLS